MPVFGPREWKAASGKGQVGQPPLLEVDMTLDEFGRLVEYSTELDQLWADSNDTFPALRPNVTVTMPAEDLERFRSYQEAPFLYELTAPFGVRHHAGELLKGHSGCWRAMGVIAGVLLLFLALPFALYVALCLGIAVVDDSFDLGAALAYAFM